MALPEVLYTETYLAFAPAGASYQERIFPHPDGPHIHMLQSPEAARLAMANDILDVLAPAADDDLVLLSTGNTSQAFYPVFIERAQERGIDLTRFRYGHIDNYIYDPAMYPDGSDDEDYKKFLMEHFIKPAGISLENFYPIQGLTADPDKTAKEYDQWLDEQHIVVAIAGALGPEPVIHIAFMKPDMDLEVGVAAIDLSDEVVARNAARAAQDGYPPPPIRAITLGLKHFRHADKIYNLNCGREYVDRVRVALTGPIDSNVIGTYLRTQDLGEKVHLYLDALTAQPIIEYFGLSTFEPTAH